MAQLAHQLNSLATAGQPITFDALALPPDVVLEETPEVAAGPFAPLLAEALTHAFDHGADHWLAAAPPFSTGLANQRSVLHLTSAVETLLASTAATVAIAKPLHVGLLAGVEDAVDEAPLLAASRLETAVRLAVSNAVSPFTLWAAMEQLSANAPDDFVERLPRVLGLALDRWPNEHAITTTLRKLLQDLASHDAADTDAMFELGCDQLRAALTAQDLPSVTGYLAKARSLFATVAAAEEARHDSEAYAAICDAMAAFTAGDPVGVSDAADRLDLALRQRSAWLLGMHQPNWLRPRLSAEVAWNHLILQLRAAAERLNEQAWMEPWPALEAVLGAYRASRAVHPVGGDEELTGLAMLVEPAIEDAFLRKHALLETLRTALTHPVQPPGFDAASAAIVLANLDTKSVHATTESHREHRTAGAANDDNQATDGDPEHRLHRLAPSLVRTLGIEEAAQVANGLDSAALKIVEGLVHDADVARLQASDPLIIPLLDRLLHELSAHPHFVGVVRQTFTALLEQTLLFLKSRADLTRTNLFGPGKKDDPPYDYRRKPEKGQREAVEADLQRDFHGWLQTGRLHNVVFVEPVNVAMGRADVMTHFASLSYLTEIKQDSTDNTRSHLEDKYLVQAAEYSNTNTPFGQLLVLDLTPKTKDGTLRLDELVWATSHRPPGAEIDRAVVAGVVTGNRPTPSAYSR